MRPSLPSVITQSAPTTGSVSTTKSASFTDQLATSGQSGAVSFVTTSANAHMSVSSSGAITTSGTLATGSYAVSGTDSDASGATGTWSYTLTVTAVAISQGAPTTASVSTTKSASFTDQLATTGQNGAVSFVTTSANAQLSVSATGAVTTSGTLAAGSYAVSGTDATPMVTAARGATPSRSPLSRSARLHRPPGASPRPSRRASPIRSATTGQNGAVNFVTTVPNSERERLLLRGDHDYRHLGGGDLRGVRHRQRC